MTQAIGQFEDLPLKGLRVLELSHIVAGAAGLFSMNSRRWPGVSPI